MISYVTIYVKYCPKCVQLLARGGERIRHRAVKVEIALGFRGGLSTISEGVRFFQWPGKVRVLLAFRWFRLKPVWNKVSGQTDGKNIYI